MHEHKPAHGRVLLKIKKFLSTITETKNAHFIVLSFVALVMLSFTMLMVFGLWSPQQALNGWKNQRIINSVNNMGALVYASRSNFNGIPSNSMIKNVLPKFNPIHCAGGNDSKTVLSCEGNYQGLSLPKICNGSSKDSIEDCTVRIVSTASPTHGELGAGRFRIIARLFPTAYDSTGISDVTYYVYDYNDGGFYCSGNSKFDSRDSLSKVESCRTAGR